MTAKARHVRGIPDDLWRRVCAAAAYRGITIGAVVIAALTDWLAKENA